MGKTSNSQGIKTLIFGATLQLFLGIIYIWSVFVIPVSKAYDWDPNKVKLTTSFMLSFFVIGILASGKIKLKTSKIVLLGGLIMSVSMLATAFVPKNVPWLIFITYGIFGGFGVGLAYNMIISAAQKNFPNRRGFATGICVCAFGASTVIFAPLVEMLIDNFNLKNTFLILSGLFFVAVLSFFSFISVPEANSMKSKSESNKKQYTTSEVIRTNLFYFIALSLMFGTAAFFILNPSFKTLAIEKGLGNKIGTVIVMLSGICNASGRLIVPILSEKIGRCKAAFLILSVTAVATLSLCFIKGYAFIVAVALIALCFGGYSSIYPVITSDVFGLENVASNYGAVMVGFALSSLLFPIIFSTFDNAILKYIVLTSLCVIGAILIMLVDKAKKVKEN